MFWIITATVALGFMALCLIAGWAVSCDSKQEMRARNEKKFKVLAQSFTDSGRIAKTVHAKTEAEAIRSTSAELEAAGFYPISVTAGAP